MRYAKLIIFVALQIFIVFIYIDQHNRWIKLSYAKQDLEKESAHYIKTKQELVHQLHVFASNKQAIKEYAINNLKMKKMSISQIRKIEDE